MGGRAYDKADKIIQALQKRLEATKTNGVEFLRKICDFLLSQEDQTLKDIGTKMMIQLHKVNLMYFYCKHNYITTAVI